jgi:hypothetical protein
MGRRKGAGEWRGLGGANIEERSFVAECAALDDGQGQVVGRVERLREADRKRRVVVDLARKHG